MKLKHIFKLIIIGLLFSCISCTNAVENNPKPTPDNSKITLTINNASTYNLYSIKWNGAEFGTINIGESKKLNVETGFGFIYFSFIPQASNNTKMNCYTSEALILNTENIVFTFTNNTIVIQQQNTSNKNTLENILLPSNALLAVSVNSRSVAQNDLIQMDKTVIQTKKTVSFTLTNVGSENLNFVGNSPVVLTSSDNTNNNCFSIIQPQTSSLSINETTTFDIVFIPEKSQTYSSEVNIYTNDGKSPFKFKLTAIGIEPSPKLTINFDGQEVQNAGTIDIGEVIIEKDKIVSITIENTGSKKLTLTDTIPVSFLEETNCFEIISQPIPEISAGSSSTFSIKYIPHTEGEESAILKIASDDIENPNMYIYLKGSGRKVYPTFTLSPKISDGDTLAEAIVRKDLIITRSLTIQNTNTEVDLRFQISLERPSDFITISCNKTVLQPGESGTITIQCNPNGTIGIFDEKIIINSNCQDQVFELFTNFKSREYSTEAYLLDMSIGGVLSQIIEPQTKEYTLTCDSIYNAYTVHPNELKYSNNASVYINDMLLETTVNVPVTNGGIMTIKIVSEDGQNQNIYTFHLMTKENYDSTDLTHFYFKTNSGIESDIVNTLSTNFYYSTEQYFYIKPVLKNPNAKIYIGGSDATIEQMQEISNNEYTTLINIEDYYQRSISFYIVSESWLVARKIYIIANY